ncbi:Rna polymerase i specific transcription initiation factor rrn3 protein [Thalictrum thalictroides]|uniref:Rna polymerase i specific transcription initiation factor rrn3 protein n=1 Tax=Thalictrum thalictroides TaxID=46969 RepID=A0A7J6XF71_THATH|nr:Rna polymerase i specific transcription initiation factor rrn3 protein [Thalictrum thalictroides]
MFFPFDPCLLKNCDRFIRPHFLYWSMVNKTYDDDDDDNGSSDEDINEDEGFIDGNSECFYDKERNLDESDLEIELEEFENSMNKMSITPRKSLKHMMPARIRPSTSPESL